LAINTDQSYYNSAGAATIPPYFTATACYLEDWTGASNCVTNANVKHCYNTDNLPVKCPATTLAKTAVTCYNKDTGLVVPCDNVRFGGYFNSAATFVPVSITGGAATNCYTSAWAAAPSCSDATAVNCYDATFNPVYCTGSPYSLTTITCYDGTNSHAKVDCQSTRAGGSYYRKNPDSTFTQVFWAAPTCYKQDFTIVACTDVTAKHCYNSDYTAVACQDGSTTSVVCYNSASDHTIKTCANTFTDKYYYDIAGTWQAYLVQNTPVHCYDATWASATCTNVAAVNCYDSGFNPVTCPNIGLTLTATVCYTFDGTTTYTKANCFTTRATGKYYAPAGGNSYTLTYWPAAMCYTETFTVAPSCSDATAKLCYSTGWYPVPCKNGDTATTVACYNSASDHTIKSCSSAYTDKYYYDVAGTWQPYLVQNTPVNCYDSTWVSTACTNVGAVNCYDSGFDPVTCPNTALTLTTTVCYTFDGTTTYTKANCFTTRATGKYYAPAGGNSYTLTYWPAASCLTSGFVAATSCSDVSAVNCYSSDFSAVPCKDGDTATANICYSAPNTKASCTYLATATCWTALSNGSFSAVSPCTSADAVNCYASNFSAVKCPGASTATTTVCYSDAIGTLVDCASTMLQNGGGGSYYDVSGTQVTW